MDYEYTDIKNDIKKLQLKLSDKIHPCLLKNNESEIKTALKFFQSDEKFLYVHGFIGTGKRQFVNYICEYLNKDIIKLEYFCKASTVCDDILLKFIDKIDKLSISKAVNLNAKITTMPVKFQKQISSIKKPFLIILHTLDNTESDNLKQISKIFSSILKENNVKLIITTRALKQDLLGEIEEDRNIFLKALTGENFKTLLNMNNIKASDKQIEDLYKDTRGYYFYAELCAKLIQLSEWNCGDFIQQYKHSEMNLDKFIGFTLIDKIPQAIRNFFWFLRFMRHGISLNALAILDIDDEYSIDYLLKNSVIFKADEVIYLQDYFAEKVEIVMPVKTEIKLHKYIIGIYEKQLSEPIAQRAILISRQALRAEIKYHGDCIQKLEETASGETSQNVNKNTDKKPSEQTIQAPHSTTSLSLKAQIESAKKFITEKKYTEAIEEYNKILENPQIDMPLRVEIRLSLAQIYKKIGEYEQSDENYQFVEAYYKKHNEVINLNYLYYEITDLYYKMYKLERAIETIKKVIYSVDTPRTLMVSSCTLLGNIYSDMNNPEEAYSYYKKALESLDENVDKLTLADLYFKYALACDEKNDMSTAFEYYNKCLSVGGDNPYLAIVYSNLASCYSDLGNLDEALDCFLKAYDLEKKNNNYDGIYYTTSHIAEIYVKKGSDEALQYLKEAQSSAEFINENHYIMEAATALGDYYYNISNAGKDALKEYFIAKRAAQSIFETANIAKINSRIQDMKLRLPSEIFDKIKDKYDT